MKALHISGSPQFSEQSLIKMLPQMQGEVWIVDLRRESHGFVDGLPVSWYFIQNKSNVGLSLDEILIKEEELLSNLCLKPSLVIEKISQKGEGKIIQSIPVKITPSMIESEQSLTQRLNLNYIRFPISDHHRPDDSEVDRFVEFIKNRPQNTWLHFHCRGGKGRSTTLMVMVDILENARVQSLNEILSHQKMIGAMDVFKISDDPEDAWKKELQKERKAFIQLFYEYVSSQSNIELSWSQWLRRRN